MADLYAPLRKQPDAMFEWLQRAWTKHDPNFLNSLLSDPFVLPYQHDPRFTALCKQAGLPLPGEALPAAATSNAHRAMAGLAKDSWLAHCQHQSGTLIWSMGVVDRAANGSFGAA